MQSWSEIVHDVGVNWPIYVAMPIIAALIGWFTKIVAIKMMFRPHVKNGIGPLGWQGIIPKRAPTMVTVLCETLTGRLISSEEIIGRVDGKVLAKRIERPLHKLIGEITPRIAQEYQPTVWNLLPRTGRDLVVQRAQEAAPKVVPDFVKKLRKNIDDVFDLETMVTESFLSDPDILESMFLDVGRREFAFIRRSGLVFGFLIGLVQVVAWALFQNGLIMPIFGLFTGWFTDWAALRLIFNPPEPKKYFGVITWQGLFLKHRIPVSEEYGTLIATRVLTTENLVKYLFEGPNADKVADLLEPLIEKRLKAELVDLDKLLLDQVPGMNVGAGDLSLGGLLGAVTNAFSAPVKGVASAGLNLMAVEPMARAAAADIAKAFPELLQGPPTDYLTDALDIKATMVEKMVAMTPKEFEGVLRPAFQADEKTIIAIGAVLGGLVGELQFQLVHHFIH